ncbi:MAG: beta-hydroxyacyl-ACP dehydratase [Alphaproteobacteria bacterium]
MKLEAFQMIDAVSAFDEKRKTLTADCVVPEESPVFEGHFPGHPLMPGVLLVETMAQASGYLILGLNRFVTMPFLAGVKNAKFRNFVEPGALITVTASLDHDGSGFAMTKASVSSAGVSLCQAALVFKIMPFPAPELEQHLRASAVRIGMPERVMSP